MQIITHSAETYIIYNANNGSQKMLFFSTRAANGSAAASPKTAAHCLVSTGSATAVVRNCVSATAATQVQLYDTHVCSTFTCGLGFALSRSIFRCEALLTGAAPEKHLVHMCDPVRWIDLLHFHKTPVQVFALILIRLVSSKPIWHDVLVWVQARDPIVFHRNFGFNQV